MWINKVTFHGAVIAGVYINTGSTIVMDFVSFNQSIPTPPDDKAISISEDLTVTDDAPRELVYIYANSPIFWYEAVRNNMMATGSHRIDPTIGIKSHNHFLQYHMADGFGWPDLNPTFTVPDSETTHDDMAGYDLDDTSAPASVDDGGFSIPPF